jgi:uncharacterized protein (DUF2235 family)
MKKSTSYFTIYFFILSILNSCAAPMYVSYPYSGLKNIVICCDGTSDKWKTRTNVRRLYEIISNQDRHDIAIYYDEGVGTDYRKFSGNVLGYGFALNIRQAYRFLVKEYKPGDKIYLFGFSRGAATVRSLASMVKFIGLIDRNAYNKGAWLLGVRISRCRSDVPLHTVGLP